ncbi:hypothetical protein ScPMuIL_018551 [Solemya velum]
MGRLHGKVALVTGAGRGIARASALAMAKEGARVIATSRTFERLKDLEKEGIEIHQLDVSDGEAIKTLAGKINKIDILFNCAGHVHRSNILECDEDSWDYSMNVNVKGIYRMCKAFIPKMIESGNGGSIINMSSICSSIKAIPDRFVYGTTKAAIIGMTKSIATDYISHNIRCNNLCPGTVLTDTVRSYIQTQPDPEKSMKEFIGRQKMGRLGQPEEIAHMVVYLASDESAFVTGQEFIIDGGLCV